MGVLASDNFNRPNGVIGANWGSVTGCADFTVDTNACLIIATQGITVDRYTATAASADQFSRCTLTQLNSITDEGIGPAVRIASGAKTLYLAQCNSHEIRLYKGVAGTFTQLGSDAAAGAVNDVIEISVVGIFITVKKNNVVIIGPISDTAIASGDWGLYGINTGGTGDTRCDNWEGGSPDIPQNNQNIRQEINLLDSAISTTSSSSVNANGIAALTTANYSGSPTYWGEWVYNAASGTTSAAALRVLDKTLSGTIVAVSTATSPGIVADGTWRVIRFQFDASVAGSGDEMQLQYAADGTHTLQIHSARIIVLQSESLITKTETQIEIGNQTAALTNTAVADITNPKFWTYTAANWDGTKTFSVEVVWTTSAKNTTTITLCRTSDNAANVTIVNAGSNSTGYTRTRVSFTPVDGETYKIRSLGSTTKSNYTIACAKIIVVQSNMTKLEAQFLLLNTNDSNATGLQNYLTTWKSGEWFAGFGSINYFHAMDSDNASNSIKLRDATAAADISNSTVTGTGQQVSSALGTLTSGNNLDTWVLNTTGVIAAGRMLVRYTGLFLPEMVLPPEQGGIYYKK